MKFIIISKLIMLLIYYYLRIQLYLRNFLINFILLKKKIDNIIIFTFFIIKIKYNSKHLALNLKKKKKIYLKLYYNYSILNLFNKKLLQQKINLFKVLIKIDYLIYRLQLFFVIKIYSIISII